MVLVDFHASLVQLTATMAFIAMRTRSAFRVAIGGPGALVKGDSSDSIDR